MSSVKMLSTRMAKKSIGIWSISEFDKALIRLLDGDSLNFVYERGGFRFRAEIKVDPKNPDRLMILCSATTRNGQTLLPQVSILDRHLNKKDSVKLDENPKEAGNFSGHIPVDITDISFFEDYLDLLSKNTLKLLIEFVLIGNEVPKNEFGNQYFEAITTLNVYELGFETSFNMNNHLGSSVESATSIAINQLELKPVLCHKGRDGQGDEVQLCFNASKEASIYGNMSIPRKTGDTYDLGIPKTKIISGENVIKSFSLDKVKCDNGILPTKLSIKFKLTIIGRPETNAAVCLIPELIKKWNDLEFKQDPNNVQILFPNGAELYGKSSHLSDFSTIFEEYFKNATKKDGMYRIQLNDVNDKSFSSLVDFFNTGKIPNDHISEFLYAAFKFKNDCFGDVVTKVLASIPLITSLETNIGLLAMAKIYGFPQMYSKLIQYFGCYEFMPLMAPETDFSFKMYNGSLLHVHKSILLNQSKYFNELVDLNGRECTFPFPGVLFHEAAKFFEILYLEHFKVYYYPNMEIPVIENLGTFLYLAKHFEINTLQSECETTLCMSTVGNALKYLSIAEKAESQLKYNCIDFIQKNAAKIVGQNRFKKMQRENPELIAQLALNLDEINVETIQEHSSEDFDISVL